MLLDDFSELENTRLEKKSIACAMKASNLTQPDLLNR